MTIHRFFIDSFNGVEISLPEEVSHQVTQVLRLKLSEQIIILDNTGWEYICILTKIDKKHSLAKVIKKQLNQNEPKTKIHLYQSLISRDNFELVLQKAVELGISDITPVQTERTQFSISWAQEKYDRFQRIIKEAAEQSERGLLPSLKTPLNFEAALGDAVDKGDTIVAWEKEDPGKIFSSANLPSINIMIGPEGGFTESEIEYAKKQNANTISLGKTILRSETAAIALISRIIIN